MRNVKKYCWVFVILILVWQPLWAEELPVDPIDFLDNDPNSNDATIDHSWGFITLFILSIIVYFKNTVINKQKVKD